MEDDADVRRALGLSLADLGYEMVPAETAHQAMAALPDVDAVLLDLTLPDVNGVRLCRAIRANPRVRAGAGDHGDRAHR